MCIHTWLKAWCKLYKGQFAQEMHFRNMKTRICSMKQDTDFRMSKYEELFFFSLAMEE